MIELVATCMVLGILAACHAGPSSPELAPGSLKTSPEDNMNMVYVPSGDFVMGSQKGDYLASPDEFPQHTVTLDAYWIDQTEVTNAMFAAFLNQVVSEDEVEVDNWLNPNVVNPSIVEVAGQWQPQTSLEDHPVVNVTWEGAQAYCAWAGRRLPTEAEWEKAARGTEANQYPWGDEAPSCDLANSDSSDCVVRHTMPVGSYPQGQSPYGALDMSGNVWEFVSDYYAADYYANSPARNPKGPASGDTHVIRGSSYFVHQYDVRAARRGSSPSSNSSPYMGFRCAMTAN